MSGGEYNYIHVRVQALAEELNQVADAMLEQAGHADPEQRLQLRSHMFALSLHLGNLADVLRAVELNDSGDGSRIEPELIRKLFAVRELLERVDG